MIIGHLLMGSTVKSYGEWTAHLGNAATFTLVVNAIGANTDFDVAIETKNVNDADPTTVLASFATITATGTYEKRATAIKQLYRLRYEVTGTGGFRFTHFAVPAIAWERN